MAQSTVTPATPVIPSRAWTYPREIEVSEGVRLPAFGCSNEGFVAIWNALPDNLRIKGNVPLLLRHGFWHFVAHGYIFVVGMAREDDNQFIALAENITAEFSQISE